MLVILFHICWRFAFYVSIVLPICQGFMHHVPIGSVLSIHGHDRGQQQDRNLYRDHSSRGVLSNTRHCDSLHRLAQQSHWSTRIGVNVGPNSRRPSILKSTSNQFQIHENGILCNLEVISCAGFTKEEFHMILQEADCAVQRCKEQSSSNYGCLSMPLKLDISPWLCSQGDDVVEMWRTPAIPDSVPGATGRILLLSYSLENVSDLHDSMEMEYDMESFEEMMQQAISFQMDRLVKDNKIEQPILVSVKHNMRYNVLGGFNSDDEENDLEGRFVWIKEQLYRYMQNIVEDEAEQYGLVHYPMISKSCNSASKIAKVKEETMRIYPNVHVEIDGAMVNHFCDTLSQGHETHFDTSSIFIFDDFVSDDLRQRLMDVIHQRCGEGDENEWDDMNLGPNPKYFVRGGLSDTLDDESNVSSQSWGLKEEFIQDICFNEHSAIAEVEKQICSMFADQFIVSRLPEAVLGAEVSPLTVNAPTYGDKFSYHIDADPNQLPPSPWTDIFGRYPNRSRGKPRFVSCLLYLNDEWHEEWGAPTQFLDPPTGQTFQVYPRPGRCVIMDQDISHTVVAPEKAAGARPRYSLVWKLILHPKIHGQSVKMYPDSIPIRIGSANLSNSK